MEFQLHLRPILIPFRRLFCRPSDNEIDEYYPRSSRTLYIGSLGRDVTTAHIRDAFNTYGEILEIDIKKTPTALIYATVQVRRINLGEEEKAS